MSERLARRHLLTRAFRRVSTLMLMVILAGIAWRGARFGAGFPVWGDEAFVAINVYERDFSDMLRAPLEYRQIVPLGFLWIELMICRLLGFCEWSLRLLPMVSGVAMLLLFRWFSLRVLDRRSALLATAILAVSYYLVRHGAEIKAYSTDALLSMVLTCLGWSLYRRPDSAGRWAALLVTSAVGVWLSLPAAFVACGVGIFLGWDALRRKSAKRVFTLATYAIVAGGSFLLMYLLYAKPNAEASPVYWRMPTWQQAWPPLSRPWLFPWWLLSNHTGNMMAYPMGGKNFGSSATFILVVWGCVSLWRSGKRDLLLLLLCPFIATLLAAAARKYPYGTSVRVSLHLAPAICLLAGVGLRGVICRTAPRRLVPEGIRLGTLLLLAIAVAGTAVDIIKPYKRLDHKVTKDAVRRLTSEMSESDQVLMGLARSKQQALPYILGTASATFRFYLSRFSPTRPQWAVPAEQIRLVSGRTWLLYYACPRNRDEKERAEVFRSYLNEVTGSLGQPRRHRYELLEPHRGHDNMSIEVYEFRPRPGRPALSLPATPTPASTKTSRPPATGRQGQMGLTAGKKARGKGGQQTPSPGESKVTGRFTGSA